MVVALINGKGGSGKTTLAVLLAAALADAGHSPALADTDPQQTATQWLQLGRMGSVNLGRSLDGAIEIIDTPPFLASPQVADAIKRADVVLLVTSPSPADLFTSRDTAALIKRAGASERAWIVFNNVQEGTTLARDVEDMAQRIGLPALKRRVHRRQIYQKAVLYGWMSIPPEIRQEVLAVALEIFKLKK